MRRRRPPHKNSIDDGPMFGHIRIRMETNSDWRASNQRFIGARVSAVSSLGCVLFLGTALGLRIANNGGD